MNTRMRSIAISLAAFFGLFALSAGGVYQPVTPIVNGGTGASTLGGAQANLGIVTKYTASLSTVPAVLSNSTADQDVLTLTIPASVLASGASFRAVLAGVQTNPITTNPNVIFKAKVNGTTIGTATVAAGTTAQTNRPFRGEATFQFHAVGSSGTIAVEAIETISGVLPVASDPTSDTAINTTSTVTLTISIALSVAATTTTAQVRSAAIYQAV